MADVKRNISSSTYDTTYIRKEAVPTLEKSLVMADMITQPTNLPEGVGSTVRWIIDANFSTTNITNALTAGSDEIAYSTRGSQHELAFTGSNVQKQVDLYGAFVPIRMSDLKVMPKGLMDRISKRGAYLLRLIWDTLIRATADGSGTGFSPSMGAGTTNSRKSIGDGTNNTTLSASDQLTAEDIALTVGDLRARDAQPLSNGKYHFVLHAVTEMHLITDVSTARLTWEQMFKYVSGVNAQEKMGDARIGDIVGGTCHRSNNITQATVDTLSAYVNLAFADSGIGDVGIMGENQDGEPDVYINMPNQNSTDNPYRLYGTASFQFYRAPALLDSARVEILYSAP